VVEAIPYLLGFHPRDSVVIVGLCGDRVEVSARLDTRATTGPTLDELLNRIARSKVDAIVAVEFCDAHPAEHWDEGLRRTALLAAAATSRGQTLLSSLAVYEGRWWSFDDLIPPDTGTELLGAASPTAATATYAGIVAYPDRNAAIEVLNQPSQLVRDRHADLIAECENAAVQAILDGKGSRHRRSVTRAVFAAARASDETLIPIVEQEPTKAMCRLAVGLGDTEIRDSVWVAVDRGRLDGRPLWLALAQVVPSPYDAAPLFLYGWASWRSGDGVLALEAAKRALASDPGYTAADLLLATLAAGLDPFRAPRLRAR
jgi:hypothetical protein